MRKKMFVGVAVLMAVLIQGCGSKPVSPPPGEEKEVKQKEAYDEKNFFELKAEDVISISNYVSICSPDGKHIYEYFDEESTTMYAEFFEEIEGGDELNPEWQDMYVGTSSYYYIMDKKGNEYQVQLYTDRIDINDKMYENVNKEYFPDEMFEKEVGYPIKSLEELIKDYTLVETVTICKFGAESEDYTSRKLNEDEVKELGGILSEAGEYLVKKTEFDGSRNVRESIYMFIIKMTDGTMATLKLQSDNLLGTNLYETEGHKKLSKELLEFSKKLK